MLHFSMDTTALIRNHIDRIVVNIGVGRLRKNAHFDSKILPEIVQELSLITGQKPSPRPAKKSIAGFRTREGDVVGLKVTLRGKRMIDFFIRLMQIVLPRVRDFRGIPQKSVDMVGGLHIGIKDKAVFPEIDMDSSNVSFGLQATIVPKVHDREQAIDFYKSVGVPLKDLAQESKAKK